MSALAAVLAEHGIGYGDRVVVQSKNSNLMLESMDACFRIGAVWVPTNFRLRGRQYTGRTRSGRC